MNEHTTRLTSIGLLGLFLILLAACAPAARSTATPAPPAMDTSEGRALAAQETLRLINGERAKVGLPPYQIDPQYTEAAQTRADQIVETEHYSHWGPNGENVIRAALKASGARVGNGCSEILAGNGSLDPYTGAEAAVDSWMGSRGHKGAVLSDKYYLVGVGVTWAGSGMDFDPGPGEYLGVGGVYVVIVGAGGEIDYEAQARRWEELLNSDEEVDLSSIMEMRQDH